MTTRPLALLASLVFAPSLACAGGPSRVVEPGVVVEPGLVEPVVGEASVATTVFLETAGSSLTPPSTCDDVVAERALDGIYDEDASALQPACEGACRADTCTSLLVMVDLPSSAWDYRNLASVRSELAQTCEASTEGCMGVVGVVMKGEDLDTIGLVAAVEDDDGGYVHEGDEDFDADPVAELRTPDSAERPSPDEHARLRDACEAGDAAACFGLVDLPQLYYLVDWDQVRYDASMAAFERACELEPRVYCRALQRMIDETTNDCSG